MDGAKINLEHGAKYPYDAPDDWTSEDGPPPAIDWAHAASRGVIADLCDRGGIKHGFNDIDEEIRAEIVESLAAIIRLSQGIEARSATTAGRGPQDESPVSEGNAPENKEFRP